MNERFTIKISDSGDYDIYDNLKQEYFIADSSLPVNSFAEEIVELLNTLHQENQKLKEENERLHKILSERNRYIRRLEQEVDDKILETMVW